MRSIAHLVAVATMLGVSAASASSITVKSPWARATPNHAAVAGGYATIVNAGPEADRLVGGSLSIAADGQVHSMTMRDGMMHMERLDGGLPIPAGATVILSPGDNHLMFVKPTAPLKEGDRIAGTLIFAKAGTIPVTFVVGSMAAKSAPAGDAHDMSGMKDMPMHDMPGHDMSKH